LVKTREFGHSIVRSLTDSAKEFKIGDGLTLRLVGMQVEEISRLIGKSTGITIYEVEKGAIHRFADAVGDMNPLYHDDEFARKSAHGSIIAPPGFFGWPNKKTVTSALLVDFPSELITTLEQDGYSLASALDGGIEYEYFMPVKVGDVLASVSSVKDIRERTGRKGKLVFFTMETVYINRHGCKVASCQAQYILQNLASQSGSDKEKANA